MTLPTTGSIATHIANLYPNLSAGVSGNLIQTVDMNRITVQNFTLKTIDPDAIAEQYQSAILNFSIANTINTIISLDGGTGKKLAELELDNSNAKDAATNYENLATDSLKYIGRGARFGKTLV